MYPKTFFATERPIREGVCFIAMPFSKEFDPVFNSIKRALKNENLAVVRTDELLGGGHIIEDILEGIASSEIVVVDVTGRNPNVFYELGIAHMCKDVDKVILLSQDVESIPFDLRAFRHIVYSKSTGGLRTLADNLRNSVIAVRSKVHRIFLTDENNGVLPTKLMGSDHCLYSFEILDGFAGDDAAKFLLKVERHIMGKRRYAEVAYKGGMGLMLGEVRRIPETEWSIGLEKAPNGQICFRITPHNPGNMSRKIRA
jgi:hypothetical protein